jgi:hypothetical protein
MLWTYKNTDVKICYDPEDMSKVYLFERFTYKFIGVIEPRMVMTRENKKDVMKKQRQILREAMQLIRNERKADVDIVNGITKDQRILNKESLADKLIRKKMKLKNFEDEVESVPVHL